MNSPYNGKFKVTQQYKGSSHSGLDLVGIDSKNIHSTVNGTVIRSGWENPNNQKQGWGLRVTIQKDGTNQYYTFGHLSQIKVSVGQKVKITDVIGVEGNTGYSTGSHCHYECRLDNVSSKHQDISAISGIPNAIGTYTDGGATTPTATPTTGDTVTYKVHTTKWLPEVINDTDYAGIENTPITCVMAHPNVGTLSYQVHVLGGSWLPKVVNNTNWAGINGKAIDGLKMSYDVAGKNVAYRVSLVGSKDYLPWVTGDSDYAGIYGKQIDKIQVKIV